MKKLYSANAIYALLILAFTAFGCSLGKIKAEEDTNKNTNQTESGFRDLENSNQTKKDGKNISSVIGTYDYDTEKDGEGYDNSLEVSDAGDGKLYIFISGSYIYKIGETQSMHEAEGKGDAILKGDTANVVLVDEAGKPCRATIVFRENTANVKIAETCQFNIALDGVYKKVNSKAESKNSKIETKKSVLPEIDYEKMMDFINDFDAHKVGEEFVITNVPPAIIEKKNRADEFGNQSYKGLFYLEGVTDDDTPSYSVLTSKAMIESLNRNAEYEPEVLRMTALIAESKGKFDIYRLPFVTKIEGLTNDGTLMWTAVGGKPAGLNFTH